MTQVTLYRSCVRIRVIRGLLVTLLASLALGCGSQSQEKASTTMESTACVEQGIDVLQAQMEDGGLSSEELVRCCLDRITALDKTGPELRAMLELNPDALAIATALDAERRETGPRGPLHGIPVVLKGNIDTGDSMATTAGALAMAGHRAGQDAFLVEGLRRAGAVILGKTNLSEWANFRSTSSSSGWSALGGQARNPYVLDRSPCGSSSGTAVAVAASMATVGIGTETDGSIVCPASFCGLVGIKPTLGLVSRAGVIPIAHSQDTAGPMARSVRDAAILLQAIASADSSDPAAVAVPDPLPDYMAAAHPGRLAGLRLGVIRDDAREGEHPEVEQVFLNAQRILAGLGAELVEVELGLIDGLDDAEYEVLLYEFRADLAAYLASHGAPNGLKSLEDVIAWNVSHAAEAMPHFGQDIFLAAAEKGDLVDPAYREALAASKRIAQGAIDGSMTEQQLDALLAPSNSLPWKIDLQHGDRTAAMISSSTLPAVSGYPSVTLPMGEQGGLPLGLTIFGAAWSEPVLLRVAAAFETKAQARRPPQFRTSLEAE